MKRDLARHATISFAVVRMLAGFAVCVAPACHDEGASYVGGGGQGNVPGRGSTRQGPPNLIVILADDLGYHDVGFNGGDEIPTPSIDSIAQAGVRFTNGYVSYSVCGPSRAGLLTGRYSHRFGFTTNPSLDPGNPDIGIPHDEKNIAELLSAASYESMIVGKWHMGTHPDHHPLRRGFDQFYGFLVGGHRYFPDELVLNDLSEVEDRGQWYYTKLMRDFERVDCDQYLTDAFSDEAVGFIESQAHKDTPFFLYLSYNAPHGPLQATDEYLRRFSHITDDRRRTYAAMVSAVDDGVGAVLDAVQRHGLTKNSIIIFLSDNGGPKGTTASNAPLRGFKGSLYEGGIRVPFAMQWTGQIPAGFDYERPVLSLDILSTIAVLAEVEPHRPLDGVNLIPYLTGVNTAPPHDMLMWVQFATGKLAVRTPDLKLHGEGGNGTMAYDLTEDIAEATNVLPGRESSEIDSIMAGWQNWHGQLEPQAFPTLADDVWW